MYVHENYVPKIIPVKTTIENLTMQLSNGSSKLILSCIYNAPAVGVKTFLKDIDLVLTSTNEYSHLVCVIGDMNIDLLQQSSDQKQYISILNGNGFVQILDEPTRITDETKTLIDHILVKKCDQNVVNGGVLKSAITDHCATYLELPNLCEAKDNSVKRDLRFIQKIK